MSAGTVISGGFPGRVAQEVQPNQKCEGCLHYDNQAGRTGACTIGDSPWKCGDGDAPQIGYAPLARGAGSYLPDMSNHGAHAAEVPDVAVSGLYGSGSTRPVEVHQVSLGEEHIHLVKSMLERHVDLQKSQCLRCSMRGSHGTSPHNVDPQMCSCRPLEAGVVAKAVVARMSNAQRAGISLDNVTQWVRDVAKAGFRKPPMPMLDVPTSGARGHKKKPPKTVPAHDDTGGHLRPIDKSRIATEVRSPTSTKTRTATGASRPDTSKSLYSEDWIAQFRGTDLFDEARKLCEQELSMEEEALKRRRERIKQEKLRSKNAVDTRPDYDWQEQDMQRDKVRIAKQRLTLKLAGLHQKQARARIEGHDAKTR